MTHSSIGNITLSSCDEGFQAMYLYLIYLGVLILLL